tara:strand:+ start:140 stop:493 length:354 start_codon:yes stop_codon:yes gene_type:complete
MHNTYITLTNDQWQAVINKVESLPEKDLYMFILRSMANSQQVSYYSIAAFNEEFIEDQDHAGQANNIYISQITRMINSILEQNLDEHTSWYIWHTTDKAWVLGWDSFNNLRSAIKRR